MPRETQMRLKIDEYEILNTLKTQQQHTIYVEKKIGAHESAGCGYEALKKIPFEKKSSFERIS